MERGMLRRNLPAGPLTPAADNQHSSEALQRRKTRNRERGRGEKGVEKSEQRLSTIKHKRETSSRGTTRRIQRRETKQGKPETAFDHNQRETERPRDLPFIPTRRSFWEENHRLPEREREKGERETPVTAGVTRDLKEENLPRAGYCTSVGPCPEL
uniref:Ubiquitin specific peptidase 18 n=1 Tax=Nothobranchius rachovii TaxID=451742 RepID=A0A1A8QRH7_9TELE